MERAAVDPEQGDAAESGGDVAAIAARGFKVSYRGGKLVVRQPPGEGNALGRIKFMFPNDFSVYLHDTPIAQSVRRRRIAPSAMAACASISPSPSPRRCSAPAAAGRRSACAGSIGGSERYINLSKPLPIHIEYFTAYVDEAGRIVLRPDLYGYSARVRTALGLGA